MADQLTLSQPRGADYAHQIILAPPGFSDLPTALLTLSIFETGHCSIMKKYEIWIKQCSGQFLKFNDHIKEGRKKGKGSSASPTKLLAFDVVQYGNLVTS